MKKIFSFLIAALFSASMWADITVGAKVPAEWDSGTISVFTWTNNTDGEMHETTHNSGWYTYTYTGNVPVNIIFVNGSDWTGGDPNQTVDITNVAADAYYEITYKSDQKCTVTYKAGYIGIHSDFSGDWNTVVLDISDDKTTASHTYTLTRGAYYHFGMRIGSSTNWTADGQEFKRGDDPKTITAGEGQCWFQADKAGEYTFTWSFADNTLAITWPTLILENGWYLVGKFNNVEAWTVDKITADKKFTPNGGTEYMVTATLVDGDELKAAYVYGDEIADYKPTDQKEYHVVDANHAGTDKTIYFNTEKQTSWGDWYFYIPENGPGTAIDNTEAGNAAVKRLVNGQLVIVKGDKTFNALGAEVK